MKAEHTHELIEAGLPVDKLRASNVLVTGANGLIASNLVEALVYLNAELDFCMGVYALCRSEERAKTRFRDILNFESFHLIVQDVCDPLQTNVHFDYIVHAASSAHPGAFNTVPVDVMKANFIGTLNLLDHCNGEDTRFIFVSSSEVYGENFESIDYFTEDINGSVPPATFRSCYPESKRASEALCESFKKQYGSDVVIVRPAFIYGRQIIDSNVRADAYFLRQVLNHKDIVMYSKGEQIRSYLYVNDCVSALLYVALKGESGEVYNIGNDDSIITLHDYAQRLAEFGGVALLYEPKEEPKGTTFLKTTRCILKADKLRSLGWAPKYSLDDGIADILGY